MCPKKLRFPDIWLLLLGFLGMTGAVLCMSFTAAQSLPDNLGRPLTGRSLEEAVARNSPLVEYAFLTPSADFPRQEEIRKITIHHMAGDLDLEALGESFAKRDRRASANYAIDSAGRVALYVEERNRPWTSSNKENDAQAVTIEVANDEIGGEWHVSGAAYARLLELCTDICRRNGISQLTYTGDPEGNLTTHKMFYETDCPGPYLEGKLPEIAAEVNRRLAQQP